MHTFQFINVNDYLNQGEHQPNPYFYQNLGEAEYVVSVYMYMRLIGYNADDITILTTYVGQKQLLKEIFSKKCENDPLFGNPHKISTVDKYQGSQNKYILLSLVRTKSIGYLRDIRRLIVGLSRQKFGLYIFGRFNLFIQCYQLKNSFTILENKPTQLHLIKHETFPTTRLATETTNINKDNIMIIQDVNDMMRLVSTMCMEKRNAVKQDYNKKLIEYKRRAKEILEQHEQQHSIVTSNNNNNNNSNNNKKQDTNQTDNDMDMDMDMDNETNDKQEDNGFASNLHAYRADNNEISSDDYDGDTSSDNESSTSSDNDIDGE